MKKNIIIAVLIMGPMALALTSVKSTTSQGKIEFEAVGRPSMIKIKGAGEGVESDIKVDGNKISGSLSFKLDSLKTGIDLRDEHMKEKYLQIKTNPTATLVFNQFQMPVGWTLQNSKIANSSFRAVLKLHGVEKEITGLYTIDSVGLKTTARFEVKLSDFKIEIPTYLGVKVADIVKISVNIDQMQVAK